MYRFQSAWPAVSADPEDIRKLYGKSPLGLDMEWDENERPTILGLSDGILHIGVSFDDGLPYLRELLALHPETKIVAHNGIGADRFVLARLGIILPLENMEDTILYHWLVNSHLSKAAGKSALEEDAGDKRGRGFFNLWSMSSLYTDLPHWKSCRGAFCSGPCPDHEKAAYCALDAAAPVLALPALKRMAALRGVDKLYGMHRELAAVLAEIQEFGLRIDVPYVYGKDRHHLGSEGTSSLDHEFRREKEELLVTLPFNPKSPSQVISYFKKQDIVLADAQEETVREAVKQLGESSPDELVNLLDYKELGNGVDRWFDPQYRSSKGYLEGYLDPRGYIHPRIAYFTIYARLMSSSPNCQNVSHRRRSRKQCECGHRKTEHTELCVRCECKKFRGEPIGDKVRQAFIAPDGWYIVRADLSNAENRVVLHLSGYTIARELDLHAWVRDMAGITEDMPLALKEGNARNAAKTIQHAGNILEGLQLKDPEALRRPKIQAEIKVGARVVFPDWTFQKKVVTFTGINLARRAFKTASFENRHAALDIAEKYFGRFPGVRDFQRRVSKQCETEAAVRPPHGYVFLSYGDAAERMKTAQAAWQAQPVAHITKLSLLNLWRRWKRDGLMRPVLQVHDEILCYVKDSVDPKTAMAWIQEDMEVETPEIPGLIIPAEPSYGPNWRSQQTR